MQNKSEPQHLQPATPEAVARWIAQMEPPQTTLEAEVRPKMAAMIGVLVDLATNPKATTRSRKESLNALAQFGFRLPDAI
jgi:hypothetical protein